MKMWVEPIRQLPIWSVFGVIFLLVLAEWLAPKQKTLVIARDAALHQQRRAGVHQRLVIPVTGAAWAQRVNPLCGRLLGGPASGRK